MMDDCWVAEGQPNDSGYARVTVDGVRQYRHRAAYEALIGPIPEGLVLDHVAARGCTSRMCYNPRHLEPVTRGENAKRGGESLVTHCPSGHHYSGVRNSRGDRICHPCLARQARARYQRRLVGWAPACV